jgi:hypothetical protein
VAQVAEALVELNTVTVQQERQIEAAAAVHLVVVTTLLT